MKLRAKLSIRNEHMIAAREKIGLSQFDAADVSGISHANYQRIERLDYGHGDASQHATMIAGALGLPVEQVMPESFAGRILDANKVAIVDCPDLNLIAASEQVRKALPSPSDLAELSEKKVIVGKVLKTLTFREREIIRLRYGIGADGESHPMATYEEIGKQFKVTRERVRQVENRALRKLQDPVRAGILERLERPSDPPPKPPEQKPREVVAVRRKCRSVEAPNV